MAKKRNQQPPEDSNRPAAAADQTAQQPNAAEEPGSITIDLQGKRVTILPKKQETDPEAIAAAEKRMQEAQKRLADAFNNSPAAKMLEQQRRITDMLRNPAIESVMQQQEMIDRLTAGVRPVIEMNRAIVEAMRSPAIEAVQNMVSAMQGGLATAAGTFSMMQSYFNSDSWATARQTLEEIEATTSAMLGRIQEREELLPYLEEELKKPQYGGKTLEDLLNETGADSDGQPPTDSLLVLAITAARAARDARQAVIDAQNEGREQRRRAKEAAQKSGAIMDLRNGIMPIFSERGLWDVFSPSRISRMGKLPDDVMDKATGRINDDELETGDIVPISAAELSYKALMLLSAIKANSVENFRETFVKDGAITFYVKGVLDRLDVDPRPHDDMQQITLDRKTAGALYLEKQFEPLLNLVGTTPNGSRYAVFNYYGYNVENDTMTIRTPYLFQLWMATQGAYSIRRANKERRIEEGKSPLKKDLKPLELNLLFTADAYKEDDAVLEIAAYITNVMLNAGRGAHKTKISYKTIIKNCSRLKERLDEIEALPTKQKLENGKVRNNAARYNVELRKIAKAFSLIMNPDKCNALKHFAFDEVTPTKGKGNQRELIPPTRRTLDGEIFIKWHLIDEEAD